MIKIIRTNDLVNNLILGWLLKVKFCLNEAQKSGLEIMINVSHLVRGY